MTDYTKLVKALTCGNDGKLPCHNNECPYWVDKWHGIGLCNVIKKDADAAAAIEDLLKSVGMLDKQRSYWIDKTAEYYNQLPKRGVMTNADKIRSMTDEELAEWVTSEGRYFGEEYEGYMSLLDWLQEDVQDGANREF